MNSLLESISPELELIRLDGMDAELGLFARRTHLGQA